MTQTSAPGHRSVTSQWTGGMRAVVSAGGFELVVDEPAEFGGSDTGPQPTDMFLASAASCFTLALVHAARKRDLDLGELRVVATGTYTGLAFSRIELSVVADAPADVLEELLPAAERVCYVTNTLRDRPQLVISVAVGQT